MSLKLEHVHVSFRDGDETRDVLDAVSLSVAPGEVVAFTGASGSGKSTLIAVAALLQQPDSGTITIAGHDASQASDAERTALRRNHIGVIYQSANLLPSLKAHEQVELMAHIDGNLNDDARKRARELLVSVGLEHRLNARPGELSGGERQRVGIARALMNGPEVLLADEPTASLDPERGKAIMDLLTDQAIQHGVATLVVTHAVDQINASRRLIIEGGKLH
ncbi:MAG: ABC transporter ATP-binding protein [Aquihabitans sp.]